MKLTGKATSIFLILFISVFFVMPFISSCSKNGIVSGASSNTQLAVFNLSPNVGPLDLYADFNKQDANPYIYATQGTYFYVSPSDTLLQVRTTRSASISIISIDTGKNTGALKFLSNHKYSLYITGYSTNISYIFTIDDQYLVNGIDTTPVPGYGALRFINATLQPQNVGLDVTANGTLAFSAVKYQQISKYILLPAGSYNFQINQTGSPGSVFSTPAVQSVTIHDGSLYTLYSYGVAGQTDTSAFNAAIYINR